MKRMKNSGLSLVELLVAVAILGIVTLGVGGLLRLAAEQYSNSTKETEVQNLSQSTFASISNALEDVALDVNFANGKLTIINRDGCILFEKKGDILYYDEKTLADLQLAEGADDEAIKTKALLAETSTNAAENVLADHVRVFSVDTSTKEQGFVVLNVTISYRERTKSLVQNVFMRNLRPKSSAELASNTTTETQTESSEVTPPLEDPGDPEDPEEPGEHGDGNNDNPPTQTTSAQDINPNDAKTELTFKIKKGNNNPSIDFKITKNGDEFVISNLASQGWYLGNPGEGEPSMPGYVWNTDSFTLTPAQIEWLNTTYGIDVVGTLTGESIDDNPDDPNEDPNEDPVIPTGEVKFAMYNEGKYKDWIGDKDKGANSISFSIKWWNNNSQKLPISITREVKNGQVVYYMNVATDGNQWMLEDRPNEGYPAFPGYGYNTSRYEMGEAAFEWLKTYFGVDVKESFGITD